MRDHRSRPGAVRLVDAPGSISSSAAQGEQAGDERHQAHRQGVGEQHHPREDHRADHQRATQAPHAGRGHQALALGPGPGLAVHVGHLLLEPLAGRHVLPAGGERGVRSGQQPGHPAVTGSRPVQPAGPDLSVTVQSRPARSRVIAPSLGGLHQRGDVGLLVERLGEQVLPLRRADPLGGRVLQRVRRRCLAAAAAEPKPVTPAAVASATTSSRTGRLRPRTGSSRGGHGSVASAAGVARSRSTSTVTGVRGGSGPAFTFTVSLPCPVQLAPARRRHCRPRTSRPGPSAGSRTVSRARLDRLPPAAGDEVPVEPARAAVGALEQHVVDAVADLVGVGLRGSG